MKYNEIVIGRSDSTVTVFVPWDCGNNCSFCTTKNEYKEKYSQTSKECLMESVKKSLSIMSSSPHVKNIVFTGGEPFRDIKRLLELVEVVPRGKKCFVNTSFHIPNIKDAIEILKDSQRDGIDGISLSSHLGKGYFFDNEVLELVRELSYKRKVRVNSVVCGNENEEVISKFAEVILGRGGFEYLSFRADYRNISQSMLGSCDDMFFRTLMGINNWEYKGFSGCLVCRTDKFITPYGKVDYHRGVERTSLEFGKKLVINDFVIKQDGQIRYDWDEHAIMTEEMKEILGLNISE